MYCFICNPGERDSQQREAAAQGMVAEMRVEQARMQEGTAQQARAAQQATQNLREIYEASCALSAFTQGVKCVPITFQPSRDPGAGWHRRRRRYGTATQYWDLC